MRNVWWAHGMGTGALILLVAATGACGSESAPLAPPSSVTVGAPRTSVTDAPPVGEPMPPVASAVPSSMSVPALGFTASVRTMDQSACPVLKPPTLGDAYWVACRAKPGTDSDGTVFIIGHSRAGGPAVFNGLQRVKSGDAVELTTPSGRLTYRVEHTTNYAKSGQVQTAPEVLDKVPGRLVLVTCLLGPDGTTTDQNFVVQAVLVAAAPSGG